MMLTLNDGTEEAIDDDDDDYEPDSSTVQIKDEKKLSQKKVLLYHRGEKLEQLGFDKKISAGTVKSMRDAAFFKDAPSLVGSRGNMSTESQFVRDCHKRSKKAEACGFHSIYDRYDKDMRFADRMSALGFTLKDGYTMDLLSCAHLANPPRQQTQVRLGVGFNVEAENQMARLVYSEWKNPQQMPDPFNHYDSNWFFLFRYTTMCSDEYVNYLKKPGSFRSLLTWKGVVEIDVNNAHYQFSEIFRENLPLALADVDRKLTQSVEQGARSREWEKKKMEGDETGSYYEAVGRKTRQYGDAGSCSGHTEAQGGASSSTDWQPSRPRQQWEWQKWNGQWWWRRAGSNDRWER